MAINKHFIGNGMEVVIFFRSPSKNIDSLMSTLYEKQIILIQMRNARLTRGIIALHYC